MMDARSSYTGVLESVFDMRAFKKFFSGHASIETKIAMRRDQRKRREFKRRQA
jgi:hypothetical protein